MKPEDIDATVRVHELVPGDIVQLEVTVCYSEMTCDDFDAPCRVKSIMPMITGFWINWEEWDWVKDVPKGPAGGSGPWKAEGILTVFRREQRAA